jgi:hypothetical protein
LEDNKWRTKSKDIENSLLGKPFTRKNPTQSEVEVWNHYANIILSRSYKGGLYIKK